jgi:arylsulfatase A-like enzyme
VRAFDRTQSSAGPRHEAAYSGPVAWLALSWAAAVALVTAERLHCEGSDARTLLLTAAAAGTLGLAVAVVEYAALATDRRLSRVLCERGLALPTAAGLVTAFLSVPVVVGLSVMLFAGRRLKALPHSRLLLAMVILTGLAAVFWTARTVLRVQRSHAVAGDSRTGRHHLIALACFLAVACGVFVAIDGQLLVRRYQWIHVAVQLAALSVAQAALWMAFSLWPRPSWRRGGGAPAISLLVVLAAAGWVSGRALWKPDREDARAAIFSCPGAGTTVAEVFRPGPPAAVAGPPPAEWPDPPRNPLDPPSASDDAPPPFAGSDVVLITVDALRADHLGLYGYSRATSPALDALARESSVFERAYTPSPHTSFALASLLTGQHAHALARNGRLDAARTLADAFSEHGYRTVGIFPPAVFFVENQRFRALEERRYGFERVIYESLDESADARIRTDQAIAVLDAKARGPLFLWVHHFGPHEPYVRHPELGPEGELGRKAVDRYDGEIRWVDHHLGRLLAHLRSRPRRAIVVVTADHGEEFGEHGGAYHGTSLFDEQIRVPLLIHLPGVHPSRQSPPVSTLDIAPTLAQLVGPARGWPFDGTDHSAPLLGRGAARDATPVFAELDHLKAVVRDGHKLICHTLRDYCQLYDLARDAGEQHDLRSGRAAQAAQLRTTLDAWIRRSALAGDDDGPGTWTPAALLRAADRWDAEAVLGLGRLLGDDAIGATHPQERRDALRIIARSPRPEHQRPLLQTLTTDPDPGARLWAAIGLSLLGDPRGERALGDLPPGKPVDPELAGYHALALAAARHEHAVSALSRALESVDDVSLRCKLLAATGSIGGALATAVLTNEYRHLRSRPCAAEALVATRSVQAVPFLARQLRIEPYSTVRANIARALGRSGDPRAAWLLAQAYHLDGDDAVAAAAAGALAELGHLQPLGPLRTSEDGFQP